MKSSFTAILVLKAMLIFSGEIRGKAGRVDGQGETTDEVGWSFMVAAIGLVCSVIGIIFTTMFRHLPRKVSGQKGGSWIIGENQS